MIWVWSEGGEGTFKWKEKAWNTHGKVKTVKVKGNGFGKVLKGGMGVGNGNEDKERLLDKKRGATLKDRAEAWGDERWNLLEKGNHSMMQCPYAVPQETTTTMWQKYKNKKKKLITLQDRLQLKFNFSLNFNDAVKLQSNNDIRVNYTGNVRYYIPFSSESLCKLDVKFFPFDM